MTVAVHAAASSGTGDLNSHNTASFTPAANSRLYAACLIMRANHASTPTWAAPGGGLTWTPHAESSFYSFEGDANYALQVKTWHADIGGAPSSISLTFDPATSGGAEYAAWVVWSQTNDEFDTGSPYPQAAVTNGADVNPSSGSASGTLTLGSAPASASKCFAVFAVGDNTGGGPSTPSGWTLVNTLMTDAYVNVNLYSRTGSTATDAQSTDLGSDVGAWAGVIFEVAEPGGGPATETDQEGYRYRNDDGSETTATWREVQDTNTYVDAEEVFRARFLIDQANGPANITPRLEWKQGGGSWAAVPVGATVPEVYDTITFGAIGTGANGSTTVAPSYPAGITAGQYLLCVVTSGATNSETPSTPSGWTLLATGASTDGSFGIDTGPRRVTVFGKEADGTESGTLTVSITNGNTCRGTISRFTKSGSGTWAVVGEGANDSTSGTGVSMTFASMNWNTGDAVLVATGQRVDSATQSSQSLTASGVTFGTRTNKAATAVTTGNDHRHTVDTFAAITGTSNVNAAPTWAYTASASASAGGVVVRLRAYTAPVDNEVYVAPSANITAGGEATTAQLAAPSGKTTSDFTAGRTWDDENGSDAITFGAADLYTEVEWAISTSAAASGTYDLRVTNAGTVLDAYLASASFTIGTPPPPSDFMPLHRKRHQVIHR
jgi:hypothetical protein